MIMKLRNHLVMKSRDQTLIVITGEQKCSPILMKGIKWNDKEKKN